MMPALLFCLGSAVWSGLNGDWAEFRGPGAAGVAPGSLVLKDGALGKPDWSVDLAGQGWSSPVIAGGLLVLTAAEPVGEPAKTWKFVVLGLDPATGAQKFRTEVFERAADSLPKIHSKNSHASPTAVLTPAGIVAHFGHVGTALVQTDGTVTWRKEKLYEKPVHGGGASPVVVGSKVIFPCDGLDLQALVALDLGTGKEAWRLERKAMASKPFSFCTVCPQKTGSGTRLLSAASDVLQMVDAETGKEIWRMPYSGYSVVPRPYLVGENLAVLSTGYDKPKLLAVRLGDLQAGEERIAWTLEKNAPLTPTPILSGGNLLILADNGVLSALQPATGNQVWQERLQGAYSASPILVGDTVVTVSEAGRITAFKAGSKFEKTGSLDLKERSLATPAVANGWMYIRTEKGIRAWKLGS